MTACKPLAEWPAAYRNEVLASRRYKPVTVAPLGWAPLRDRARSTVINEVREGLDAAFEACLTHLESEFRPTGGLDPIAAGVLIALAIDDRRTNMRFVDLRPMQPEAVVDHLVVACGHALAVAAIAEGFTIRIVKETLLRERRPFHAFTPCALRMRDHLSTAPQAKYDEAAATAARILDGLPPEAKLLVALMFPGEDFTRETLFALAQTKLSGGQLDLLVTCFYDAADLTRVGSIGGGASALTLLAQCGVEVVPILCATRMRETIANALAMCETEQALTTLLDGAAQEKALVPALETAVETWPALALRVLPAYTDSRAKSDVVPIATGLLRKLQSSQNDDREAEVRQLESLPAILREPPWLAGAPSSPSTKTKAKSVSKKRAEPIRVPVVEDSIEFSGKPRKLERTTLDKAKSSLRFNGFSGELIDALIADAPDAGARALAAVENHYTVRLVELLTLPEELARALMRHLPPKAWRTHARVVARLFEERGLEVLPFALALGGTHPRDVIEGALVVCSPKLAPIAAVALASKTGREAARAWLTEHPRAAAAGLLDMLAGPNPHPKKRLAEPALVELASLGHEAVIRAVAAESGSSASDLVSAILERDPLAKHPAKMPAIPSFAEPERFERPTLAQGAPAPLVAVERLVQMLTISSLEEPYAGVALAKPAFAPSSLARFSWALFEAWRLAKQPADEIWAFHQLAFLGGDDEARKLGAYVRAWPDALVSLEPGKVGLATTTGIAVLARLETPVALGLLASLAEKSKPKLEAKARERLEAIAESRGLELRALLDDLTPDFGLDSSGTRAIDYGARTLTLEIDDDLVPFVRDERSTRHASPPKAAPGDDAALVATAAAEFKALKGDLAKILKRERSRLEEAMIQRESFAATHPLFTHPVLSRLARRLVWLAETPDGRSREPFVWAEDGAPRTLSGQPLDRSATLRLAHPVDLQGDEITRLRALFGTARPLFPQLDRPRFALPANERDAATLTRFAGPIPTERLFALESRRWVLIPGDSAIYSCERRFGDITVTLRFAPGMPIADRRMVAEQVVASPAISSSTNPRATFGALSPVAASEVLAALTELFRAD
ncbi:MAG: DUF4132 domain-containing protein [Polyangiaceae bacterium]